MAYDNQSMKFKLLFDADTTKAQKALTDLQSSLKEISAAPGNPKFVIGDKDIKEASKAALELQTHLRNAFNVKTGNLDLSRFSASLNANKKTLSDYRVGLSKIHSEGNQTFLQLAQSMALAEAPTTRMNAKMQEFLITLKNTAKWQISSSILHGFMGSLQKAYGYAQDLDESLNNIRIVTGNSKDEMAEFAKQANIAAKELSTTTTSYTDAALIFYQQGLTGDAVTERTDATIKMANVTGQSAEEVSSYMTAIWNNFDDGSKSLEHYSDVITALGAKTASSSAEIAEGLEKFAAIGNTVGLSYEYATAALATVVAQTRQSADTVGTAFKTLFARIQDLEVGETLDDGTTLGKYAQALASIGVNVKDANGQVREMNDILDDMGDKWKTISKDQQIAVAQTVAGTRQYAQLMALMANYDTFKANVGIAENSEGALQEQADIYAESWEAANKRVKAAAQGVYDALLNEETFIKIDKVLERTLETVEGLVKGFGGLGGMLQFAGAIFLQVFANRMPTVLNDLKQNLMAITGLAQKNMISMQDTMKGELGKLNLSSSSKVEAESYSTQITMKQQLLKNASQMNEEQQKQYELRMEAVKLAYEEAKVEQDKIEKTKEESSQLKQQFDLRTKSILSGNDSTALTVERGIKDAEVNSLLSKKASIENKGPLTDADNAKVDAFVQRISVLNQEIAELDKELQLVDVMEGLGIDPNSNNAVEQLSQELLNLSKNGAIVEDVLNDIGSEFQNFGKNKSFEEQEKNVLNFGTELDFVLQKINNINNVNGKNRKFKNFANDLPQMYSDLNKMIEEGKKGSSEYEALIEQINKKVESLNNSLEKVKQDNNNFSQNLINNLKKAEVSVDELKNIFDKLTAEEQEQLNRLLNIRNVAQEKPEINTNISVNLTQIASSLMSVYSMINTIDNAYSTFTDEGATATQNIGAAISILTTSMFAMTSVVKSLNIQKALENAITANGVPLKLAEKVAREKVASAATEEAAANALLRASMIEVYAILAALVIIIGIIIKCYKDYQKNLEDIAKKTKETAEEQKELVDKYKEEVTAIDSLINKYNELSDSYNTDDVRELQNEVYELCKQYGEQSDAVKALGADYEELGEILKNLEEVKKKTLYKESINNINAQQDAVQAAANTVNIHGIGNHNIQKVSDSQLSSWETTGWGLLAEQGEDWNNTLTKIFGLSFDKNGNLDMNSLAKAYSENGSNLIEYLNETLNSPVDTVLKEKTEDLIEILNNEDFKEAAKNYSDSLKTATENYYINPDDFNINSLLSYQNAIIKVANSMIKDGLFNESEMNKALEMAENKIISSIDDISRYAQENSIAKAMKDSGEDTYISEIKKLTKAQIQFILSNEAALKDFIKEGLEGLKKYSKYIDIYSKKTGISTIGTIFADKDKDTKKLSKSEISDLYGNSNIESYTGMSESEFGQQDLGGQQLTSLDYIIKEKQAIAEETEEIKKQNAELKNKRISESETESYYKTIMDSYGSKIQLAASNTGEDYEWRNEGTKDLLENEEERNNLLAEYADKLEEVGDEQVAINSFKGEEKEALQFINGLGEDELKNASQAVKLYKKQEKVVKNLLDLQEYMKEGVSKEDLSEYLEQNMKQLNTELDNLQSVYKTLKNAETEYNTTKGFTADTFQQLIDLSPRELDCLFDENNQIKLNTESLKQATLAKYDAIEANKLMQLYNLLLADSEGKVNAEEIRSSFIFSTAAASTNWLKDEIMGLAKSAEEADPSLAGLTNRVSDYIEQLDKIKQVSKDYANSNFDSAMAGKSSKDKKELKKYNDEFNRYHDIKEILEEIDDALSDLDKRQSHLHGKQLAQSLRNENKLLEQQAAAYRELAAEQRAEQSEVAGELSAMGVSFDSTSGQIINYAQVTADALATLNEAITTYNNSAQTEADKKILEAAEKNYENFKKKIERYDALIEELRDTENKLDDIKYKEIENNLKAWKAEIEVDLDLNDAEKTWKKFLNEINKDFKSVFKDVSKELQGIAEQASDLTKSGGNINIRMNAMSQIEGEIDKMMAGGESNMFVSVSEAQESLKEYMNDLQSDAEELYDLYKSAWDGYIEGIEQAIGKFDDLNDKYEDLNDQLSHQAKMIELLYGDDAYGLLNDMYNAQSNNLLGQLDSISTRIAFYQEQYQQAIADWGEDSEAAQKWKEAWQSASKELRDKEEEYIESIKNKASTAIDEIFNKLEKKMTGGTSFNYLTQNWEDAQKAAENYYDDVERLYKLEDIQNKYQDAINNAGSLKSQQRLKAIMEDQVSALENKTQLSKYDIELAEKRLEVYKAQIALEEAQNNKNSMKLTRGADGNWSYQYVADNADIEDKEQNLMDKQYDVYEFVKNSWQEMSSTIVSDSEEALNRIAELEKEALGASVERQTQIASEIEEIKERYWGEDGIITNEIRQQAGMEQDMNVVTAETLWTLYDIDLDKYTSMNQKEKELLDKLTSEGVNSYETLYDTVFNNYEAIKDKCVEVNEDSLESWTTATAEMCRLWNSDDGDSLRTAVAESIATCTEVFNTYIEDVNLGVVAAGEDFTDIKSRINEVEDATKSLSGATNALVSQSASELAVYRQYVLQAEQAWNSMKQALINAMNQALEYLRKVGTEVGNQINKMNQLRSAAEAAYSAMSRVSSDDKDDKGGSTGSSYGTYRVIDRNGAQLGTVKASSSQEAVSTFRTNNAEYWAKVLHKELNIAGAAKMATGGYTGTWSDGGISSGDNGKLAVLHQKELVLNESDTSNILKVVDMVRQMGQNMINGLLNIKSINTNGIGTNTTNNDSSTYIINAEFPNANDVNEIREAILSLPNYATQYVNR